MHPTIGFLTQHGKEHLLAPVLEPVLAAKMVRVEGFDTDTLGTFTREVARRGTQVDAAARKAELALELSDADWGLGSEGSFHLDPYLSLLHWNTEVLVMIERRTGHRVVASANGKAQVGGLDVSHSEEAAPLLERLAFPAHALVLRAGGPEGPVLARGVQSTDDLRRLLDTQAAGGIVHMENDLRAHLNPTRQAIIRAAGEDLARRLSHHCPACGMRGFGLLRPEPGAPCRECGQATRVPIGDWWSCTACEHQRLTPRSVQVAEPERCDHCNP